MTKTTDGKNENLLRKKIDTARDLWKEGDYTSIARQAAVNLGIDAPIHRLLRTGRRGWTGLAQSIGRAIHAGDMWEQYGEEAAVIASYIDFNSDDLQASHQVHTNNQGPIEFKTLTWFIPDIQHAFYGGIYTILRFADFLRKNKGIQSQFAIVGLMTPEQCLERISSAFPALADSKAYRMSNYKDLQKLEATDGAIATLWATAYYLLRFNRTRRKFYFMQDYEPLFYPAGSTFAQVEASYRFGFYGLANTPTIKEIYEQQYNGKAEFFYPCVDTHIFHPGQRQTSEKDVYSVFFYGRPGHPRNGFELGAQALHQLKRRMGKRVRILSAGANWKPGFYDLHNVAENLGLLSYQQTAELYRECDAGLVMMFTRHPSYLPFELMASGALVVTNHNPSTVWMLHDRQNCLLSEASPAWLATTLEEGLLNTGLRRTITAAALEDIGTHYNDWPAQIEKIHRFMCNPITNAA